MAESSEERRKAEAEELRWTGKASKPSGISYQFL
jgi:hypothetical protein